MDTGMPNRPRIYNFKNHGTRTIIKCKTFVPNIKKSTFLKWTYRL